MAGLINVGTADNDGTGDPLRTAFQALNAVLPVRTITASEALSAGDMVNLHISSGIKMRKADADDTTKPAHGFVRAAVSSSAAGQFYGLGLVNDAVSGLTPGTSYYLSTSAGGVTATPPGTALNGQQFVGVALSATELATVSQPMIEAP